MRANGSAHGPEHAHPHAQASPGTQGRPRPHTGTDTGPRQDTRDRAHPTAPHPGTQGAHPTSTRDTPPPTGKKTIGCHSEAPRVPKNSPEKPQTPISAPKNSPRRRQISAPKTASYDGHKWHVTAQQLTLIEDLLDGITGPHPEATYTFFVDVLRCQTNYGDRYDEGVPYPWDRIAELPDAPRRGTWRVWVPLEAAGLLEVSEYVPGDPEEGLEGRCREYSIPSAVRSTFAELAARDGVEEKPSRYDAYTGKATSAKHKTSVTDASGHSYKRKSDAVYAHLRHWKKTMCPINLPAYKALLKETLERAQRAREAAETAPHDKALQREAQRLWGYLGTAQNALTQVQAMGLEPADDLPEGIYQFTPAYEVQELSGRLSMIGGGLQCAPKAFKAAAYRGTGIRNYDIVSSQTTALLQFFEEAIEAGADLDITVLTEYPGKDALAAEYGVPRTVFKRAEHAPKFGAGFRFKTFEGAWQQALYVAQKTRRRSDSRSLDDRARAALHTMPRLALEIAEDPSVPQITDPEDAYDVLRAAFGPMAEQIKAWRDWLQTEHWAMHSQTGGGGRFIRNPCGLPFDQYDYPESERGAKYATTLLQGLEAAFITHLTLISEDYDYAVVANEHDGVIVKGTIPDEAIAEARKRSGFRDAELIEKDFEEPHSEDTHTCSSKPTTSPTPSTSDVSPKTTPTTTNARASVSSTGSTASPSGATTGCPPAAVSPTSGTKTSSTPSRSSIPTTSSRPTGRTGTPGAAATNGRRCLSASGKTEDADAVSLRRMPRGP